MNKILLSILLALSFGCSKGTNKNEIKVAATPVPHAEMLKFIQPDLQKEGIELKILEMTDYQIPNRALAEKEVDANFFQHIPFMEEQIATFGYPITCYAKIHLEPMGLYSRKIKKLSELKQGDTIAIPNDSTNEFRALALLQKEGIVEFSSIKTAQATVASITKNPLGLKFKEVDAALLPRVLDDVALAAINTNFALQAHFKTEDALALEGSNSPYVNIIAIRKGDESNPKLMALKKAMLSNKMRDYINSHYKNEILPILKDCE